MREQRRNRVVLLHVQYFIILTFTAGIISFVLLKQFIIINERTHCINMFLAKPNDLNLTPAQQSEATYSPKLSYALHTGTMAYVCSCTLTKIKKSIINKSIINKMQRHVKKSFLLKTTYQGIEKVQNGVYSKKLN